MRANVTFRIGQNGLNWLGAYAHHNHYSKTDVIRAALVLARRNQDELKKILEEMEALE